MALEHYSKIDLIGIDKETQKCVLTITDELNWANSSEHLQLIQNKINNYLEFIISKQIDTSYPDSINKIKKIDIIASQEIPFDLYTNFQPKIKQKLNEFGIEFQWEKFDQ